MYFDIIYNKKNNKIVEVRSFHDNISASSTSDLHGLFDSHRANGIDCGFVPWAEDLPMDTLQRPHHYSVGFEDGFTSPTFIFKENGVGGIQKFDIKTPRKVNNRRIVWFGSFLDYISYSNITRDSAFYLARQGYNIGFFSTKPSGCVEISEQDQQMYEDHKISQESSFLPNVLKVISYVPLSKAPKSTCSVLYSLVESFGPPSDHVAQTMESYYTEGWVCGEYAADQFRKKIGDDFSLHVMPLWFDEKRFYPNPKPYECSFELVNPNADDYPKEPSGFKFLNISRFTYRKGFDALLAAFAKEFNRVKDDVCLILFTRHILNVDNSKAVVMKELRDFLKASGVSPEKIPPIYAHMDPVPHRNQAEMYGWADAFVYPSRGEGFGLPVIEAAACKIPILASNHTGLSDFVNEDHCLTIGVDELEKCGNFRPNPETGQLEYYGPPGWRNYCTPFYIEQMFQKMGDKSVEEMQRKMRYMYEECDSREEHEKVDRFYDHVQDKYTFSRCIGKIQNRIDYLLDKYGSEER